VYPLRFGLAKLYEATQRVDQAKIVYQEIIDKAKLAPQGIEARNRLAQAYAHEGKYAEAESLVAEVLKENPKDRTALVTHGKIAVHKNDARTAVNDFRAALRDDPNSSELLRLLAGAHAINNEAQLAEDTLNRAIEANPRDTDARIELAQLLARSNKLDAAIGKVRDALKAAPNNLNALTALYQLQMANKDLKAAQMTTEEIIKAYPDLPGGYQMAGVVRQAQQDFAGSIENFEAALIKAPNAVDPLTQLVNSWLAQGKPEKAIERLDQVLKDNPTNFVAINIKAELMLAQKKLEAAEPLFKKAIELSPQWAIPYRGLAMLKLIRKDTKGAAEILESALGPTNNAPLLATDLAALHEKMGNIDAAIAVYEKMLAADPKAELATNNLAMLLADHRSDQLSLERAASLATNLDTAKNAAYLDTVGWVQVKRGEYDKAIESIQKAIDIVPNAGVMRYHLAAAYAGKGDHERARAQLKKALEGEPNFREAEDARALLDKLKNS
jgi:tetratricopeptide (TPR) repeat protein